MQNLESVAQKMAELLHWVRKRTLSLATDTDLHGSSYGLFNQMTEYKSKKNTKHKNTKIQKRENIKV